MAFALRSSHGGQSKYASTRDRERREEIKKLEAILLSAESQGEKPVIPKREIFNGLDNLDRDLAALPTPAECAVHLQLLEKFVALKQKVLTSNALDRTFAIAPKAKLVTIGGKRQAQADQTFKNRQESKWPIFVRIAAARFLRWWSVCKPELQTEGNKLEEVEISLPPIDVLMVWHAFLLNPVKYETFCKTARREEMLKIQFPWLSIHRSLIDDDPSIEMKTEMMDFNEKVGEVSLFESLASCNDHDESVRTALQSMIPTNGKSGLSVEFPGLRGTVFSDRHWQSASTLGAFVERQASFAEKMANLLWLRSPAVGGILERALIRYEQFMVLFKNHPGTMFVPTLDIDLIWHTQQCSPTSYQACCNKLSGRVINHDDSLEEKVLKNGLAETIRLYELQFQEECDPCLCWDCEAMKSELENHALSDSIDYATVIQKVQNEVMYYKAMELARRKGNPCPTTPVEPEN